MKPGAMERPGASREHASGLLQLVLDAWDAGLAWTVRHLPRFVPADPTHPPDFKQITELALFYGVTSAWHRHEQSRSFELIGRFLVDVLGAPLLAQQAQKLPAYYNPYFLAYLPLRSVGDVLPRFEEALDVVTRAGYPAATEDLPYRELEWQYVTWKARIRVDPPSWQRAYEATTLARARNPIHLRRADAYSVTHTLFYLTEYGYGRPRLSGSDLRRVIDIVEALTVVYCRNDDWDLVGELLLNLVGLDEAETPLFCACAEALLRVQHADGSVPQGRAAAPEESDDAKKFDHCYHPTLVMMLFCGAYIHRSRRNVG